MLDVGCDMWLELGKRARVFGVKFVFEWCTDHTPF